MTDAQAQWFDKSDGCGLGWKVTDSKTFSATTTRGVTNVFIPPTFGMSSGTLGCETHGLVTTEGKIKYFVSATFDHLLNDLSNGEGEYLDQYLSFYSCHGYNSGQFKSRKFLQAYLKEKNISPDSFIAKSENWMGTKPCK